VIRSQNIWENFKPQNTQNRQKKNIGLDPSASSAYSAVLQHFDQISEAPDAIRLLRRFILDLAVRGKLVEQDPNDEPAAELLKSIKSERDRLIGEEEIRKREVEPDIDAEEVPFDIPENWRLVRLGDALELINGRAFKPSEWSDSGLPIIRIQNLNNFDANFNYCGFSVPEKYHVKTGDFLISWSGTPGTSFGAHIWDRGPAILNQHIFKAELIGSSFLPRFLKLAINSRLIELIEQAHGGAGLQHVTKPKLERLPLTLPPLAEQHRIVAKVDELMKLCDELEAAQQKRERRRDRLVTASLAKLTDETEKKSILKFSVSSACSAVSRPEHIRQLRQTILNLAVRGKLVSQNSMDESASDLLELIAQEQRLLIENGHLKRRMLLDDSKVFRGPHSIPKHWLWVPLAKLITFGPQNGVSPKPTNDVKAPKALTLTATTSGYFNSTHYKHIELNEAACEHYWLSPGDVLFQRGNSREYVGIATVFDGPERSFVFPDLMIRVRFSKLLDLRYIHMALISPLLRRYFSESATGASSSMPKISQGVLLNTPIPLPPLSEQHCIVKKVDELMALCDGLEAPIKNTSTTRCRLLEAILQETFRLM
jgi:type I restriction enzyme, S subunit